MLRLLCGALLLAAASLAPAQSAWPRFRGPTGQGHADRAPLTWSETTNIRWRAETPGRGWSSPVIAGDRVWLTSAVEAPDAPDEEATDDADPTGAPDHVQLLVLAYDRETGRPVHRVGVDRLIDPDPIHALNSYASPTPVVAGGRVFCSFGSDRLVAIDAVSGEIAWRASFPIDQGVGAGSSLAIYEPSDEGQASVLLVVCDGMQRQFVVGLDAATGDTLWQTNRPPITAASPVACKSFGTPIFTPNGDAVQAIIPTAQWICGYNPATGRELWRFRHGDGFSVVPVPVFRDGVVYFSTGFQPPVMIALRVPQAVGSVGEEPMILGAESVLWRNRKQAPTQPSPLLVGDQLVTVSDQGIASAVDAMSGAARWRRRLEGAFSASPLAVGRRVYLSNRDGLTTVLDLGAESRAPASIATNRLPGQLMASPAAADGGLYVRTTAGLFRLGE